MATVVPDQNPGVVVLDGVTFKTYARLARRPSNRHLRMTYHDGILEIVSPRLALHEIPSGRLAVIVSTTCELLNRDYLPTHGGTFQRKPSGRFRGVGKEPDQSFYITSYAPFLQEREIDLDAGDPPPDLWVEVDNRVSSAGRLPVYALLGIPEVWCYRSRTDSLRFLRLVDGRYEEIERSLNLPVLTPAGVLEALTLGRGVSNLEWGRRLRGWIQQRIADQSGTP